MNITFSDREIAEFPAEVKEFLTSYVSKRLTSLSGVQPNHLRLVTETDVVDNPDKDEKSYGTLVLDQNTDSTHFKNPYRELLNDDRFDWYKIFEYFLKRDNRLDTSFGDHDFLWVLEGDYVGFPKNNNHDSDFEKPGVSLLFLALFGFGGRLEGIEPATTPKEFIDNVRLIGIPIKNYRSAGPLLKSLTSFIRNMLVREEYCGSRTNVNQIHWFNLEKKTNKFYFPKESKEACVLSCQKLFDKYFGVQSFASDFSTQVWSKEEKNLLRKFKIVKP
tara:strand:- start:170 stop:994 length:825 start_codon:yes stop_codon:yes gene_type:complete